MLDRTKAIETKKNQIYLSVLLLTLIFFSIIFSSVEAGHENHCTEDSCPICFVLQVVESNLEILVLTFTAYRFIRRFVRSEAIKFSLSNNFFIPSTLFSLKIRLND